MKASDLIDREEARRAVGIIYGTDTAEFKRLSDVIDKIPYVIPSAQARIEAAIKWFKKDWNQPGLRSHTSKEVVDLCRYFLGQPQNEWTDKDFGLETKKEEK